MKTKEKILDRLDDLRIYFLSKWKLIRKYCIGIKRCFVYFKTLSNIVDYDYTSVLEVERKQLERLRDNIERYHNHENANRDIEKINLALRLLNIVLNGDNDVWESKKYVNVRNARRFMRAYSEEWLNSCIKNNTSCAFKAALYEDKAWKLYNQLRYNRMFEWWD